jgi:alkaline phosphatase D
MHKLHLLLPVVIFFSISCAVKKRSGTSYTPKSPLEELYRPGLHPFYYNVASGDPLRDAVIIWTKVLPTEDGQQEVLWEVSKEEDFDEIMKSGKTITTTEDNFTVKVDVRGLEPGTSYYYRFFANDYYSPVGRTRTLPAGDINQIKLAVVSCSNWEWGYFNAYRHIAEREDVDAVIHLGDYIYEYGIGRYGDTTIGRLHLPPHEIVTLDDYRTRYSQYRLDLDLQQVHQMHPFITIWDDHEIANNSFIGGAQNHQPDEGDYEQRKANARKAYYEWMPVRESKTLYRSFQFGDIAQLIMLDERLEGRTKPAPDSAAFDNLPEDHTMLGEQQLQWFLDELEENNETWQVIGNQVIFSYLNYGRENINLNPDSWDGYPLERKKILDHLIREGIDNVIFLTGDTHSSWAFEVTPNPFVGYDSITGIGAVAAEFGTTSVNSGNADERFPADSVLLYENYIIKPLNPHLKYVNMRDHGYLLLTLGKEQAKAEWYIVSTLRNRNSEERLEETVIINKGEHKLQVAPQEN